jgi:hypothetical protein
LAEGEPVDLVGAPDPELKAAEDRLRGIVEAHHALVRPNNSCGIDDTAAGGRHTEWSS